MSVSYEPPLLYSVKVRKGLAPSAPTDDDMDEDQNDSDYAPDESSVAGVPSVRTKARKQKPSWKSFTDAVEAAHPRLASYLRRQIKNGQPTRCLPCLGEGKTHRCAHKWTVANWEQLTAPQLSQAERALRADEDSLSSSSSPATADSDLQSLRVTTEGISQDTYCRACVRSVLPGTAAGFEKHVQCHVMAAGCWSNSRDLADPDSARIALYKLLNSCAGTGALGTLRCELPPVLLFGAVQDQVKVLTASLMKALQQVTPRRAEVCVLPLLLDYASEYAQASSASPNPEFRQRQLMLEEEAIAEQSKETQRRLLASREAEDWQGMAAPLGEMCQLAKRKDHVRAELESLGVKRRRTDAEGPAKAVAASTVPHMVDGGTARQAARIAELDSDVAEEEETMMHLTSRKDAVGAQLAQLEVDVAEREELVVRTKKRYKAQLKEKAARIAQLESDAAKATKHTAETAARIAKLESDNAAQHDYIARMLVEKYRLRGETAALKQAKSHSEVAAIAVPKDATAGSRTLSESREG